MLDFTLSFFFTDPSSTECSTYVHTVSLHDALPIEPGESIRAFPLSNWTELAVWRYIEREDIPAVPLYFAASRPTVERDGAIIMVDDDRFPLRPGDRKSTRLNSSHSCASRMPHSACIKTQYPSLTRTITNTNS